MLHEIEEDERWMQTTETHADKLRGFVDDVLQEDHRDEFESLDPEHLSRTD
jgi:hypothetical protein